MSARILVIHDQGFRRDQMRVALETAHHVTVSEGVQHSMKLLKDAELKVLNAAPFDLIVSAVHLDSDDELSVFDLLKWCRGNNQLKNVPFVLIDLEPSTSARFFVDAVRGAGSALGANAFLTIEHFDPPAFLSQLDGYLEPSLRAANDQVEGTN